MDGKDGWKMKDVISVILESISLALMLWAMFRLGMVAGRLQASAEQRAIQGLLERKLEEMRRVEK